MSVLFPFAIQNMLSRLDVSILGHVDEDSKRKGKKKKRKSNYGTLKFSLRLPNLGEITVNVIHNADEIFILFKLSNESAAQKLENLFIRLETYFENSGYANVHIGLANSKKSPEKHNWMSKLLKNL